MDAESQTSSRSTEDRLRWGWIVAAVLLGAALIWLFERLAEPSLIRADMTGLVVVLALLLLGILVGYRSRGETIRETGVAGFVLMVLVAAYATFGLETTVPGIVWLVSPFFGAAVAMSGGWVGEMLQGTLEEAHEDRRIDWPWVVVSVIIGFSLAAYAVFVGRSRLGLEPQGTMLIIAASFLVTGWLVGFFSPGRTLVEPAIAAGLMIVLNGGFLFIWFEVVPATRSVLLGFAVAVVLGLLGGWLGETSQRFRKRYRAVS